MKARLAWLALLWLLAGQAWAESMLGWPDDGELTLSAVESQELTSAPLFNKRLGRVRLDLKGWKFVPGNFSDPQGNGRTHVERRLTTDYLNFLKSQSHDSGMFPHEVKERIALQVSLLGLRHESSVGASAESSNPVTSGAVMTTRASFRYELVDQQDVLGAWEVTTAGRSNSVSGATRLADSTDIALKRNLRSFLLKMQADLSPGQAARATRSLAALGAEVDNTRGLVGSLVLGIGKTANAAGSVVSLIGQNSGAIAAGLNETAAQMDRSNKDLNQAYTQSVLAGRPSGLVPSATQGEQASGADGASAGAGAVNALVLSESTFGAEEKAWNAKQVADKKAGDAASLAAAQQLADEQAAARAAAKARAGNVVPCARVGNVACNVSR